MKLEEVNEKYIKIFILWKKRHLKTYSQLSKIFQNFQFSICLY